MSPAVNTLRRTIFYGAIVSAVAASAVAAYSIANSSAMVSMASALFAVVALTVSFLIVILRLLRDEKERKQTIALEKMRIDLALNSMTQGLVLFDAQERIVASNVRYIEMYGLSPKVVKPGCTFRELIAHRRAMGSFVGDLDEYHTQLLEDLSQGTTTELLIETPDGRAIRIINKPLETGGWLATHEDITVQRRLETERDANRRFLDLIIENVPSPIIVKDAITTRYALINRAGEEHFGMSRSNIIGKTAREIWRDANAEVIEKHDRELLESGGQLFFDEHRVEHADRPPRFLTSKRLIIPDANGRPQYLVAVIEDVTLRRNSTERISYLAHHDSLTELPNRMFFREQFEHSLRFGDGHGNVALLYLDLDEFKTVNDTLGHPVGDEFLKVVAARLRGCVPDNATIARLGGDEFGIIQPCSVDRDSIIETITRIQAELAKPFELAGHFMVAATSIGVAVAPDHGRDPDQLLQNADLAMYAAKADGRGTYRFFEPIMDSRLKERRQLEFDLREAIMCRAFELCYQPLIKTSNISIAGFESLLRWPHPRRGNISPGEFVPLAEETGLIVELGEWVLRTACEEAALWPDHIKIAVNLSPVQFKAGNLVEVVRDTLAATGLPARRLELEITEAVLIRDDALALNILHQLRAIGVCIAMDDFGTGYSSLSYLQRFPFDKIKIDRSFVSHLEGPDSSVTIIQAVTAIARARNIVTTAEGVETEQQFHILRDLGVSEIQGFLFSRPLRNTDISQFSALNDRRFLGAA